MPVDTEKLPLLVLAIGGHGLSHPGDSYAHQRSRIEQLKGALHALVETGVRLLVVHGNGPQVGRLLQADNDIADLDIHTAQTQGELGYLLSRVMPEPSVALVTRVTVTDDVGPAVKPIGPVLSSPAAGADCVQVQGGWRVLVSSPRPNAVVELDAIRQLLLSHHVVAGGGGGVPVTAEGVPLNVVIDKDWVACQLAVALQAELLVYATDVDCVYGDFGSARARPIPSLDRVACEKLLASGSLDAGSMHPKVASAHEFVELSAKRACICAVHDLLAAIEGLAGTQITPGVHA